MKRTSLFLAAVALPLVLAACGPTIRGSMALHSRDYDQAVSLYQEALRTNPENTRAACLLGQAYYRKGMNQQAVDTLETLLSRRPDDPQAPIFLGLAYLALGDRDNGFASFERFQSRIYRERRNVRAEAARLRDVEPLDLVQVEESLFQTIKDGFIEQQQIDTGKD